MGQSGFPLTFTRYGINVICACVRAWVLHEPVLLLKGFATTIDAACTDAIFIFLNLYSFFILESTYSTHII